MTNAPDLAGAQTAKHTFVVFGGNAASTVMGFLANILVMRALGPEKFGVVVVATIFLAVLAQFTGRGLDQAMVRCIALFGRTDPERSDAARATVHQIKIVLGGILTVAGFVLAWPLTRFFLGAGISQSALGLGAVGALGMSLWTFNGACLQAEGSFRKYSAVHVANAGTRLVVTGVIFFAGVMTPALAMLATAAAYFSAAGLGYFIGPKGVARLRGRSELRGTIYTYSKWLIISSFIHLLYMRLDQLMLSRMIGPDAAGLYGAAATFIQIVDLLTLSQLTVLLPRMCRNTDPHPLRQQAWHSVRLSLLLAITIVPAFFLASPVMALVLGSGFAESVGLFKIIFFGAVFTLITHPLQAVLQAREQTHILTAVDMILLFTSALCNFIAIGYFGVVGAAAVALFTRVLSGVLLAVFVVRALRVSER